MKKNQTNSKPVLVGAQSDEWKWIHGFLEVGQFVMKLTVKSAVGVNVFHFKAFLSVQSCF